MAIEDYFKLSPGEGGWLFVLSKGGGLFPGNSAEDPSAIDLVSRGLYELLDTENQIVIATGGEVNPRAEGRHADLALALKSNWVIESNGACVKRIEHLQGREFAIQVDMEYDQRMREHLGWWQSRISQSNAIRMGRERDWFHDYLRQRGIRRVMVNAVDERHPHLVLPYKGDVALGIRFNRKLVEILVDRLRNACQSDDIYVWEQKNNPYNFYIGLMPPMGTRTTAMCHILEQLKTEDIPGNLMVLLAMEDDLTLLNDARWHWYNHSRDQAVFVIPGGSCQDSVRRRWEQEWSKTERIQPVKHIFARDDVHMVILSKGTQHIIYVEDLAGPMAVNAAWHYINHLKRDQK